MPAHWWCCSCVVVLLMLLFVAVVLWRRLCVTLCLLGVPVMSADDAVDCLDIIVVGELL